MTFQFSPLLHESHSAQPILISGPSSINLNGKIFLTVNDAEHHHVFEIRYEYHCSPFNEVMLLDSILAVGHEEHFYLFDLKTNTNLIVLKLDGYFGHLHLNDQLFYVAGASELYCIDKKGTVIWKNANLGVDGVIVSDFGEEEISGTGEWDPPGGWLDFRLNKFTGEVINSI